MVTKDTKSKVFFKGLILLKENKVLPPQYYRFPSSPYLRIKIEFCEEERVKAEILKGERSTRY